MIRSLLRTRRSFSTLPEQVWRYSGKHAEGKAKEMVVMGGVHGNELLGVEVVRFLRAKLEANPQAAESMKGNLTLGIGNPPAVAIGKRATEASADLNRCFAAAKLIDDMPRYEEKRSRELAPLLSSADILLDIHATNKPGPCFVRIAGSLEEGHHRVLQHLREASHKLLDPDYILGGGVATTDEYVGQNGGVGICYETGQASDLSRLESIKAEVLNVLKDEIELTFPDTSYLTGTDADAMARQTFILRESILLEGLGTFEWAPGMGRTNFEFVPANVPFGYHKGVPVSRPYDLSLVFPKVEELFVPGKPIVWLAESRAGKCV
uniref:Succinylglutamate desuccinylase/Aspartoacylase catalytic domain-containing protein n=1 Tax=Lotharella globosa TaxID=91324 RepID=A0A6V3QDH6_9EUKA|mmetsp:Transcript_15015/g.29509  ORF Transcript_15015/g.29509 Transcript_15015/m.29509 type:complete len:322 (-) Transcript_15015:112-1077(-)